MILEHEGCKASAPIDESSGETVHLGEMAAEASVQGLGASDCKTELSRRNILGDSGTDHTAQHTLVAE